MPATEWTGRNSQILPYIPLVAGTLIDRLRSGVSLGGSGIEGGILDDAHPEFEDGQLVRLAQIGTEERFEEGQLIFERGRRRQDVLVVLDGTLEFADPGATNTSSIVSRIGPRQFSGELDLLLKQASFLSCRSITPGRLLRVDALRFQQLLRTDADIADLVMQAWISRRLNLIRSGCAGVSLIGPESSAALMQLQRFLSRNSFPHKVMIAGHHRDASILLKLLSISPEQLPLAICPDKRVLCRPTLYMLAEALGISDKVENTTHFDVAIVGAGPSGLASAVYASSEGLTTLIVEGLAPGGQAGTSSRIENYLGFPVGVSGQELADRAQIQAKRFGARMMIAREATKLKGEPGQYCLELSDGVCLHAKTVIVASGARYRRLSLPDYRRFDNNGVHYAATEMEGALCAGEEVAVVGGGNSAGQAAMFLAQRSTHVHLLLRGKSIQASMSSYLADRIVASPRITIYVGVEVQSLGGQTRLERIAWGPIAATSVQARAMKHLFVMIGADPNTTWLPDSVALDANGFVLTGRQCMAETPHETSMRGVFAVGDVRSGSVKRVASAVGEGSVVIAEVHTFLAALPGLERRAALPHDREKTSPNEGVAALGKVV